MDCSEVLASGPEGRSPKPSCNPSVVMMREPESGRRGMSLLGACQPDSCFGESAKTPGCAQRSPTMAGGEVYGPLDKTEALVIVRNMRT